MTNRWVEITFEYHWEQDLKNGTMYINIYPETSLVVANYKNNV